MLQRYKYYLILILSSLLLSCSGSNDDNTYEQNKFVHELLLDRYLWYREVETTLNYNDFDSPEQTLDFLKFHELDRFSYIADAAAFDSLFIEGQYLGYGFSFFIESDGTVPLKFVYDDSPAGRAELQRGDQILSINNQLVGQITAVEWQGIFGPKEEGYPVKMLVRKKDGTGDKLVQMKKAVVNINTVLHHSIIDVGADKVGYLVFNSFLSTSNDELLAVFSHFSGEGVNKLILDLRYNGGGSVSVSRNLASYIFGDNNTELFALLKQNDKHQDLNSSYYFTTMGNGLNLEHVVVITTGATASASEMVINGLKPFFDVKALITIGSKTFGKPVGMNPVEFDDKVILPITFATYNQLGEGGYFNGIAADCFAEDDLAFAFGNAEEPMLSEALFVMQNNTCSSPIPAQKITAGSNPQPSYSLQAIIGAH